MDYFLEIFRDILDNFKDYYKHSFKDNFRYKFKVNFNDKIKYNMDNLKDNIENKI